MALKKLPLAIPINSDFPSLTIVKTKDPMFGKIEYQLLSIPFYLTEQIFRLLDLAESNSNQQKSSS